MLSTRNSSNSNPLYVRLAFRVSATEKKDIEDEAKKYNLDVSTYLKTCHQVVKKQGLDILSSHIAKLLWKSDLKFLDMTLKDIFALGLFNDETKRDFIELTQNKKSNDDDFGI